MGPRRGDSSARQSETQTASAAESHRVAVFIPVLPVRFVLSTLARYQAGYLEWPVPEGLAAKARQSLPTLSHCAGLL